ncbi:MAG: glycosyltransferase family 87 protein [Sulfurisoma sp.]|nr:glycosyltransferase family 87 protein [Sulfurisoma sp.]
MRLLTLALGVMLASTAINLMFHALYSGPDLFKGRICETGHGFFPGPLFHPWDRFMDYFNMQAFKPAQGQTSALPPALILLYQLSGLLTSATGPALSILAFSLFQMALFSASICRLLSSPGVMPGLPFTTRLALAIAISISSYPIYFAIDRGNFALIVCALLNFAIGAHLRGRRWDAAILIGLAAALRITPLVFAAIYLNRRDFRYFLAAAITAMLSCAIAMPAVALLLDGYTLNHWLDGFGGHDFMYTTWTHGLGWSSSLYNFVRFARYLIGIPLDAILESAYLAEKIYSLFALLLIMLIVWRIRTADDDITSFALLAWAFVALPHVTGDYYLATLIGPMVLLATRQKPDLIALGLLVLLLVPKDYFYYYVMPHRIFDFPVQDFLEYHRLLSSGYKPSSIQSLIVNPLLLLWLLPRIAR